MTVQSQSKQGERIAELEAENARLLERIEAYKRELGERAKLDLKVRATTRAFAEACHIIAEQGGRLPAIRALEAHPGWAWEGRA